MSDFGNSFDVLLEMIVDGIEAGVDDCLSSEDIIGNIDLALKLHGKRSSDRAPAAPEPVKVMPRAGAAGVDWWGESVKLYRQNQKLRKALKEQHDWHLAQGEKDFGDGITLNMADEYGDSAMYERTVAALDAPVPAHSAASSAGIVAWIAFAGNGNIRIWTDDPERAEREKARGMDMRGFTLAELVALTSLQKAQRSPESETLSSDGISTLQAKSPDAPASPEPDAVRKRLNAWISEFDEILEDASFEPEMAAEFTQRRDDLKSILTALSRPAHGGWQDISTAPKNGTPILAANSRHPSHAPVVVRWTERAAVLKEPGWVDAATASGDALYLNPNYFDFWMPAPMVSRNQGEGGGPR